MDLTPLFSTILTQLQLVGAVIGGIWLAWNGWPGMEQRLEQRYSCGSRLRTDREGGEPMMLTAAVAVASNSTMRRFVAWMSMLVLALVLLIASMTTLTIAATPGGLMTSALVTVGADLPLDQWVLMQQAATASGCGLDWSILAGVEKVETDFGRNPNMSVAHDGGIVGLVQMQPGNWAIFAPPGGNPFDPHDALIAAARFLCAHGAAQDIRGALFAYNHLDSYVADVLRWSQLYAGVLDPRLTDSSTTAAASSIAGGRPDVVGVAETWKGVPYLWGGASRRGIDCSGLVMVVFAQFGVQLPHNAQLQFESLGDGVRVWTDAATYTAERLVLTPGASAAAVLLRC